MSAERDRLVAALAVAQDRARRAAVRVYELRAALAAAESEVLAERAAADDAERALRGGR